MIYAEMKLKIKEAMVNKDTDARDVLKMVVDKARAIKKEKSPNDSSIQIDDETMLQAVQKELKQLHQTKDILDKSNVSRDNKLLLSTTNKIQILSGYLPKQLTKDELNEKVANILSNNVFNNFGEQMKAVMKKLKGKADNKLIKEVVENYNSNK